MVKVKILEVFKFWEISKISYFRYFPFHKMIGSLDENLKIFENGNRKPGFLKWNRLNNTSYVNFYKCITCVCWRDLAASRISLVTTDVSKNTHRGKNFWEKHLICQECDVKHFFKVFKVVWSRFRFSKFKEFNNSQTWGSNW